MREIVEKAHSNGFTLWDTAVVYGMGHSETVLAQALKGYARSEYQLSTKFTPQIAGDGDDPVADMLDGFGQPTAEIAVACRAAVSPGPRAQCHRRRRQRLARQCPASILVLGMVSERSHIGGVSDDVLAAVARALRLHDHERTYLFDLARSSRPESRTPSRRRDTEIPPRVQWLLDSMTMSSAFVRNGRTDVVVGNSLARALYAPMFDSATIDRHGRPNIARYIFLDPGARDFFVDRDAAGIATAALLRAEAGREPRDRALRELVGELCTLSSEFRGLWAAHDVLIRHDGIKRLRHPEVGHLELTFQSLDLPCPADPCTT